MTLQRTETHSPRGQKNMALKRSMQVSMAPLLSSIAQVITNFELDQYTMPSRMNLSDSLYLLYTSGLRSISGYGVSANISRVQAFKAENMVLLTDGYCGSTCAIFGGLMTPGRCQDHRHGWTKQ